MKAVLSAAIVATARGPIAGLAITEFNVYCAEKFGRHGAIRVVRVAA